MRRWAMDDIGPLEHCAGKSKEKSTDFLEADHRAKETEWVESTLLYVLPAVQLFSLWMELHLVGVNDRRKEKHCKLVVCSMAEGQYEWRAGQQEFLVV